MRAIYKLVELVKRDGHELHAYPAVTLGVEIKEESHFRNVCQAIASVIFGMANNIPGTRLEILQKKI